MKMEVAAILLLYYKLFAEVAIVGQLIADYRTLSLQNRKLAGQFDCVKI